MLTVFINSEQSWHGWVIISKTNQFRLINYSCPNPIVKETLWIFFLFISWMPSIGSPSSQALWMLPSWGVNRSILLVNEEPQVLSAVLMRTNKAGCETPSQSQAHTVYPIEYGHGFDMLCFVVVIWFLLDPCYSFTHVLQGYFKGAWLANDRPSDHDNKIILKARIILDMHSANERQWETMLHCNVVSYWLSPYPERSLWRIWSTPTGTEPQ